MITIGEKENEEYFEARAQEAVNKFDTITFEKLDVHFNAKKLLVFLNAQTNNPEKFRENVDSIFKQISSGVPPKYCTVKKDNFGISPDEVQLIPEFCFKKSQLTIKAEKEQKEKRAVGSFVILNFLDNVQRFYDVQPFFYDRAGQFWVWNDDEKRYRECDEVDLMNALETGYSLSGQTISSSIKSQYLEAFKRYGRQNIPEELPPNFIQFKGSLVDLKTGNVSEVTPRYFLTNPIPWELGDSEETPIIDKLFTEWLGDEKEVLYEVIAYCCYRDYPIHIIVALVGGGRNGKSQFQKLHSKFLGDENVSATELDSLLENRFESIKLYKKLAVQMGETNFGVMSKTSLIKKLSGQDLIGFERKNQKPFDAYNYAKILINSNSLPSSEDTSEGFYRRWHIINFQNEFAEGKDVYLEVPDYEFNNLARKVLRILPELLKRGHFSKQGSIEQRKKRYIEFSNPLSNFIESNYVRDPQGYVRYGKLHQDYVQYLSKKKMRIVSWKEFNQSLSREGLEYRKTTKEVNGEYVSDRYVEGIKEKNDNYDNYDHSSTPLHAYISPSETSVIKVIKVIKNEESVEETHTSSPKDLILAFIKARQNDFDSTTNKGQNGHDVLKACEQLGYGYEILKQMSSEGLIFESPADHWRVL